MPDNFQQTVDLRDKIEKRRPPAAPAIRPVAKKAVAPLEKIYRDETINEPKKDWQKINRPATLEPRAGLIKAIVFILAILLVSATVYWLFFSQRGAADLAKGKNWYAVKLADGTIYYGQIFDLKASPLAIKNVYYNYDQAKQTGLPTGQAGAAKDQIKNIEETGNLRLVKRGQETQGGDGSIILYPSNGWPIIEPLKSESKVLQAILQYEK